MRDAGVSLSLLHHCWTIFFFALRSDRFLLFLFILLDPFLVDDDRYEPLRIVDLALYMLYRFILAFRVHYYTLRTINSCRSHSV